MKAITSRDNPRYKSLKQLAQDARARKREGQTLLDGVHLCDAYLEGIGAPLLCVVSESAQRNSEVAAIIDRCLQAGGQCVSFPDALYRPLSQVESGVGILFVIAVPQPVLPSRLSQAAVLLDRVQDPGNLGSILRSAASAGIKDIYCNEGCAAVWSPRVLRAGMGAHFLLQIYEGVELANLLMNADVSVYATSSHADKSLYDLDLRHPVAWIFGNEGTGVSEELLAFATHTVSIPHKGLMESLNVAASAAVCFFEQLRQTRF